MKIELPELSLVLLVGVSCSGKSTFARKHFKATEVLGSDAFRGWVADDPNSMDATADAFAALRYVAGKRLARGLMTVVDATNLRAEDREPLLELAREHHVLPVAIVLEVTRALAAERNAARTDRVLGDHAMRQQHTAFKRDLRKLRAQGCRQVWHLKSPDEAASAVIERTRLWNDRKDDHGPFDVIGDVHGCYEELIGLLGRLGWTCGPEGEAEGDRSLAPPTGHAPPRKLVFLGDLVDRGPNSPAVLRLVMRAVREGVALCVPGNHERRLVRKLTGRDVRLTHGLAETIEQFAAQPPQFAEEARAFMDGLVSHYVLDGGRLVVAHAGLKEELQGRASPAVREFCYYGETTGETDEYGLPVRFDWAREYRGRAAVVYGHTPVQEAQWVNGTICVDTGCVYGGALTALRWPERELVAEPAARIYAEPVRPPAAASAPAATSQQLADDLLDLGDVLGKRIVDTRLQPAITVREENATAALEIMSRFAADPRWLIHLPPTMSPVETSTRPDLLEHPDEAFDFYARRGAGSVVCEEKHMGSRALVVVTRNEETARARFGVTNGEIGACLTRTGRRFFAEDALESEFLRRIVAAAERSGLWSELASDWMLLDGELMPWSVKAGALIREQYAAVGSAGTAGLRAAVELLEQASARLPELEPLLQSTRMRAEAVTRYESAYRRYCWPVTGLEGVRFAPFHLLASEGRVHVDRDHAWHLAMLAKMAREDDLLVAIAHRTVDLADDESRSAAVAWWEGLVGAGGEGMVVKPAKFIHSGARGVVQPAVKCRGPEYLRIIYGPEYLLPANLERLRARSLKAKRALAVREFALGIEALERFVRREPLRRVHECVFAVLALESEPVDPRL